MGDATSLRGGPLGIRLLRAKAEALEVEVLVLRLLLAEANEQVTGPLHDRIADVLDVHEDDGARG